MRKFRSKVEQCEKEVKIDEKKKLKKPQFEKQIWRINNIRPYRQIKKQEPSQLKEWKNNIIIVS